MELRKVHHSMSDGTRYTPSAFPPIKEVSCVHPKCSIDARLPNESDILFDARTRNDGAARTVVRRRRRFIMQGPRQRFEVTGGGACTVALFRKSNKVNRCIDPIQLLATSIDTQKPCTSRDDDTLS